jgi:5-formyltetrahydrofolate cyclo-ligase
MKKAELRKLYLQKMKGLNKDEYEIKSKKISDLFFSTIDVASLSALHTFLPIIKNNEVNTHLIIEKAIVLNPDLKIIIPKSDFTTLEMTGHVLTKEMKMVKNKSGILEPEEEKHFDEREIDAVVLPLLSFDNRGYRVGYGKGFYDRFLKKCRKDVIRVGVSFFSPVDRIEDVDSFDEPLDFCITPDKVFSF